MKYWKNEEDPDFIFYRCSMCLITKPKSEFYFTKGCKYPSPCNICSSIRSKEYRNNPVNRCKMEATRKTYTSSRRVEYAEYAREWRKRNLKACKRRAKRWRQANPDKTRESNARRRSARLQRAPPWLSLEHRLQIKRIYAEAVKQSKETGTRYEVDHIVPLRGTNVSGLHVPWNLQIITRAENLRKCNVG